MVCPIEIVAADKQNKGISVLSVVTDVRTAVVFLFEAF